MSHTRIIDFKKKYALFLHNELILHMFFYASLKIRLYMVKFPTRKKNLHKLLWLFWECCSN